MSKKFAVLIDVDNISFSYAESLVNEVKGYGEIVICRAYGDWSSDRLQSWKEQCSKYAIRPMMQIQAGKNSSDGLIYLDAMEIKAMNPIPVDSFCIVSSDSDFSSLSIRLRESGYYVIGIGNENAKISYINTFHKYIYLSNLISVIDTIKEEKKVDNILSKDPVDIINEAYNDITDEKNWVYLSTIGNKIYQKYPAFDYRTYGFAKMLDLVRACSEIYEIKDDACSPPGYLIKQKENYDSQNNEKVKLENKVEGIIERIVGNYGFIRFNEYTYFFHSLNLKNCGIDDIVKGQKVSFIISKKPNINGETNQEKNGIAAEVEVMK
jgi:hypothetical protein